MSVRWERFSGDTSRFAIKIAFHADPDNGRGAQPDVAASWGALQLWVDGVNLCAHVDQGETLQSAHWYMLPVLEWLALSWDPLLHEERLPSPSSRFESAADLASSTPTLLFAEIEASRALVDDERRFEWEQRHSIRVAREGGLLPDIRLRRLRDEIEVSWNNTPLAGAAGVEFVSGQGRSLQEPIQVAGALHEVLLAGSAWLHAQRPDSARIRDLAAAVDRLQLPDRVEERTAWLAGLGDSRAQVIEFWRRIVDQVREFANPAAFEGTFASGNVSALVLGGSCEAALLFGSANPRIEEGDALTLARLLLDRYQADAPDGLEQLVRDEPLDPDIPAWEHGYELAEELLDEVGEELVADWTDVDAFLAGRGIIPSSITLADRHVRAISFASPSHTPTIAINMASRFAHAPAARRFTLAHELCHLLYDRSSGARLAVASGPWAPRGIERRANAFAAMLLMSPTVLTRAIAKAEYPLETPQGVEAVASQLRVSPSALVEHAYNVGLIDELTREDLGVAFNRVQQA
jgi:Zn-dependent peptidase ImmA (M78 family)